MKIKFNLYSKRFLFLLNLLLILLFTINLCAQEYEEHSLITELKSLLQDIEGLTFRQAGSKVVVEGEIYTFVDKQKFDKIMEIYSQEEVVNLVIDRTTKYQVGVSIIIASVNKRAFGEYNPQVSLSGTLTREMGEIMTSIVAQSNILSAVSYWVTKGQAEVVYNERITTVDGEFGKILIGGEYPFAEVGPEGFATTTFKEFGVKLEVQPFIQGSGDILVKILTEASEISPIAGQPALASRSAETTISVANGGTAILGGLQKTSKGTSVSKVPVLGDLLPMLFKKKQKIQENSELLFLVTATSPPDFSVNDFFLVQESKILEQQKVKKK